MIYVGSDHRGFAHKKKLIEYLIKAGYSVKDTGDKQLDPEDDYPVFAGNVSNAVLSDSDKDSKGILLCGSGQGMVMAANRFKGIRAALCWDRQSAKESRNDDDSNVICLPADKLKPGELDVIVETWLNTPFAGAARFVRRIKQLDEL